MDHPGFRCLLYLFLGFVAGFVTPFLLLYAVATSPKHKDTAGQLLLPRHWVLLRILWAVSIPCLAAALCYSLRFDKSAAVLLLLMAVLVNARLAGPVYGILASIVSAGLFSFLFLRPVWSLRVEAFDDQMVLLIFLLTTAAASRLVGSADKTAS